MSIRQELIRLQRQKQRVTSKTTNTELPLTRHSHWEANGIGVLKKTYNRYLPKGLNSLIPPTDPAAQCVLGTATDSATATESHILDHGQFMDEKYTEESVDDAVVDLDPNYGPVMAAIHRQKMPSVSLAHWARYGGFAQHCAQDEPARHWRLHCPAQYLAEILRLETPCDVAHCCAIPDCPTVAGRLFQCLTCHDPHLYCQSCTVKRHETLFIHQIQVRWAQA